MPTLFLEQRRKLLVYHAQWIASIRPTEQGGQNKGQLVEFFQKAVDGKAQGEPWCLAFVWACIQYVDGLCAHAFDDQRDSHLYPSEHVLTMWRNSPAGRAALPSPGDLMLWNHHKAGIPTEAGHVGIVVDVPGNGVIRTVEGNTSSGEGVVREGDGVYERVRDRDGAGDMRVLGYLTVWGR